MATNNEALKQYNQYKIENCQLCMKSNYDYHVKQLEDGPATASTYGIKQNSMLHKSLNYFHAALGFPPDISHDLLEGIVPYDLSLCIGVFIRNGYFKYITEINRLLLQFDYQYTDSVNKPQPIPIKAVVKQSVGGSATENRTLLWFRPRSRSSRWKRSTWLFCRSTRLTSSTSRRFHDSTWQISDRLGRLEPIRITTFCSCLLS
jgi:hypothetical protein